MPKSVLFTPHLPKDIDFKKIQLHCTAYADGAVPVPIGSVSTNRLKFSGGFWRVQHEFNKPIQIVRGKDFVLHDHLDRQEDNLFEYYRAALVFENCYGKCESEQSYIVAKYETDEQTYWGYGTSIEAARAYLGIKLYDVYKNQIHALACRGKTKR